MSAAPARTFRSASCPSAAKVTLTSQSIGRALAICFRARAESSQIRTCVDIGTETLEANVKKVRSYICQIEIVRLASFTTLSIAVPINNDTFNTGNAGEAG